MPAVLLGLDVVAFSADFYPRHILQPHHRTVAGRFHDDLAKLLRCAQLAPGSDGGIQLLPRDWRQAAQLPCRNFGILRFQRAVDIGWHQGVFLQFPWIQPDAHRVIGPVRGDVADAINPANLVDQGTADEIADIEPGNLGIARDQ